MIYTLTLNPSLDYIVQLDHLESGKINRSKAEHVFAGGKGINVSIVLNNLGVDTTAIGFVAGFSGAEIENRINEMNIRNHFIKVNNGFSRINVKVRADQETEINGQGPIIDAASISEMISYLDQINEDDMLVISGSIPQSFTDEAYEQILRRMQAKNVRVVLDTQGRHLKNALKYKPFLIKPNQNELNQLFDTDSCEVDVTIAHARELQKLGARNVLVSAGGNGALLLTENGMLYESKGFKGNVVNTVGAGDSMVAGFLYGLKQLGGDYCSGFVYGLAAGSASAFSLGLTTKEKVDELIKSIENRQFVSQRQLY